MSLKFCANLSFMFQECTNLLERYQLARDAGFKAVELAFPYDHPVEEVVTAKNTAGVEQILINAFPGEMSKGDRGLAAVPGREEDFIKSVEQAITYAKALNCKRIHIMAGFVPLPNDENLRLYQENLKKASSLLEESNIVGLIEPINNLTVPNYYLNNYKTGLQVLKNVNSTHLKLQLDVFHLQHISGNISRNIHDLLPYVGHIQIAQVPHRNEPDTPGEIDYKYVFSVLEKEKYDGWIGLEYNPKSSTVEGLKWIKNYGYNL